ncbi:DMT family transporter [Baekduia sp. Peel2402]|uniref:DMT family transporter n=1 Tax=Baekduia sp. Peel2402 TaxID=3458296 RepID=UPI00403E8FE7
MSFPVAIGLLLALCCSVVGLLGFLFKQRGAVDAPEVQLRHPWRSTKALFSNRWWTLGIIVATGGWVFHVAALAMAPISLVQSVIAGGLVLLTPLAGKVFHLPTTRRDWIGVGITAAGLTALAATLGDSGHDAHRDFDAATLWIYVGVLTAGAAACCAAAGTLRTGPALAFAAGLLWGGSDVTIKAASADLIDRWLLAFFTPEAATITILSLIGLVVSARSLQIGPAVAVIAITSAAANVVTIAAGPIVFGEPLPSDTTSLVFRLAGFAAVVAGAVLTPGPEVEEAMGPDAEAEPAPA